MRHPNRACVFSMGYTGKRQRGDIAWAASGSVDVFARSHADDDDRNNFIFDFVNNSIISDFDSTVKPRFVTLQYLDL